MRTISKLAKKGSRWSSDRRFSVGGLMLAALTMQACSPAPQVTGGPPHVDSEDTGFARKRAAHPSFYEDNPTYISRAPDDGFWKTSAPAAQGLDENLLADAAGALTRLPSALSLLIIRNGFLVTERYFHGSRQNHSNNLHSASKSIVSALVGIALSRGHIKSLDQTLDSLLPRYRMKDAATAKITLRELLSMASGLAWDEDNTEYNIENTSDWVQAILDLPIKNTPGTRFNYSTGNVHLIAAILTQAMGQPLPDFANQALFNPLGITFEHWGHDPQGIASGGYNLYMTPRALARFALMAHHGGQSGGKQLVPADWIATSVKPHEPRNTGYHYGYLYWLPKVSGHAVAKMWGYGGQFAYLIPDADMVVVMTNDTQHNYPEPDGDAFMEQYIVPAIK